MLSGKAAPESLTLGCGGDAAPPATKLVGIAVYPGANALDVAGPAEVFATANALSGKPHYRILLLSRGLEPVETETGLLLQPHAALNDAPPLDTLIIPGGANIRQDDGLCASLAA